MHQVSSWIEAVLCCITGKAVFRRSRPAGCFACLHTVDLIAPVTRPSSWAWKGNETMEQWFSCSAYRIWWSDLFSVPAEIRRHGCRSRKLTESVTATFGRNRKYAESVKIYSFGAETETEIQSNINAVLRQQALCSVSTDNTCFRLTGCANNHIYTDNTVLHGRKYIVILDKSKKRRTTVKWPKFSASQQYQLKW